MLLEDYKHTVSSQSEMVVVLWLAAAVVGAVALLLVGVVLVDFWVLLVVVGVKEKVFLVYYKRMVY